MGVMSRTAERLGLVIRESVPNSAGQPMASITPRRAQLMTLDDRTALSLDAVYRAVQVIQTAACQLTIDVWDGTRQIDAPDWITTPDPWMTRQAWIQSTIASLALRGNAYWSITRTKGVPTRLAILNPLEVTVSNVPGMDLPRLVWKSRELNRTDCAHLALMRRPGTHEGLGPIQAAADTVAGSVDLRRYAADWTRNGQPNGVLTTDQILTQEQADAAKQRWLENVRSDQPVVLNAGLKYTPLMLKPSEIQWIDAQRMNVTSIARLFGIPARLIMAAIDGMPSTYANQQQEDLSFVRWTLMTYLVEIEAALSNLLPAGQTARFNLDAILRGDTTTRYQAHATAIGCGLLTVDEARAIEGLQPLRGTTHA